MKFFKLLCILCIVSMLQVTAMGFPLNDVTTAGVIKQGIAIKGTIADEDGMPVPGVNILEKGTLNGVVSDASGQFLISVSGSNSVLIISFIGYATQEIMVGEQRILSITLTEDTQRLEEIIVVGYGTQQRRDITGSVAVVDAKDLLKSSGSSAVAQLQGKASGVYISTSGAAGGRSMVRIRGINTLNDNGPLYVVDGVSTRNQDLASMNPNDIESMQVLKDASASAIYGAQAANGVILITTKKGTKSGQPVLTYDGYFGTQMPGKRYDLLNSKDRMDLEYRGMANQLRIDGGWDKGDRPSHELFKTVGDGFQPYPIVTNKGGVDSYDMNNYFFPDKITGNYDAINVAAKYSDTDWWKEVHRDFAPIQSHQIGLSGGNDKGQYQASVNIFDQKSIHLYRYFKRYTTRLNTSFDIRPWLRVGENLSFAWWRDLGRVNDSSEASINSYTYRATPWVPVYDMGGNFAGSIMPGTGNWTNPVANLYREKDNYWTGTRLFGNVWGEVDLFKGLTFRSMYGLDYGTNYSYRMNKMNLEFSESPKQNNLRVESGFAIRWQFTNTLTYRAVFDKIHRVTAMLGTEAIRGGIGYNLTGQRENYMFEDNTNTWVLNMGENNSNRVAESSYAGEFALFGIFGRVDYSLLDKYLLTVNVRRDGCSRFSSSNRYGTFPSASLGWRVSEEAFMMGTRSWLDDLKFRLGYGLAGNSELPTATNYASTFELSTTRSSYALNGSQTSNGGFRQNRIGNVDTKWEAVSSFNVGVDATLLKGKFGFALEWYDKKTTNMMVTASYSAVAGDADYPYINLGDMNNRGWDLTLSYHDSKGDFRWDVVANVFHYVNKVVKMSEDPNYERMEGGTRLNGATNRTKQGRPIAEFYGYKVDGFYETPDEVKKRRPLGTDETMTDADAKAWVGRYKFAKANGGEGALSAEDRMVIGNPHPDLIASLNIGLSYKNFDLTMFWYSTIGNDMFNNTKAFTDFQLFRGNRSVRMRDLSWKGEWEPNRNNSKAVLPIVDAGNSYGLNTNSYFVEKASFLRMKNLVVGYTFPKTMVSKATIQNLRIYAQVENALTFTKYSGLDPEITNTDLGQDAGADLRRGLDMGSWPNVIKILFGVNFAF